MHYPQTFSWAKLLTLNMFSKVPCGRIKKVINFAFWFDIRWYGLALYSYMLFDELKCYSSASFKLRSLKWGGKSFFSYYCDTQKQSSGEFAKCIGKKLCRRPFLNKVAAGRPIKKEETPRFILQLIGPFLLLMSDFYII